MASCTTIKCLFNRTFEGVDVETIRIVWGFGVYEETVCAENTSKRVKSWNKNSESFSQFKGKISPFSFRNSRITKASDSVAKAIPWIVSFVLSSSTPFLVCVKLLKTHPLTFISLKCFYSLFCAFRVARETRVKGSWEWHVVTNGNKNNNLQRTESRQDMMTVRPRHQRVRRRRREGRTVTRILRLWSSKRLPTMCILCSVYSVSIILSFTVLWNK